MLKQIQKILFIGIFLVSSSPALCFALESNSYIIQDEYPNYVGNVQNSNNYALQGDSTWHMQPVTGSRFSIVPSSLTTISDTSSSAQSIASAVVNESNGVRPQTITNLNNSKNNESIVNSVSSQSNKSESMHPATTSQTSQSSIQEEYSNSSVTYSSSNSLQVIHTTQNMQSDFFEHEPYLTSLFMNTRKVLTDGDTVFTFHTSPTEEENNSIVINGKNSTSSDGIHVIPTVAQQCCVSCESHLHYFTEFYLFALLLFIDCIFILIFLKLRCEYNQKLSELKQCNNT